MTESLSTLWNYPKEFWYKRIKACINALGDEVPRFFIEPQNFFESYAYITNGDAHHMAHVLRFNVGDVVEIGCMGRVFLARITSLGERMSLDIAEEIPKKMEPPIRVYMLMGLTKGDAMTVAIEKSVELGAYAVIPVACRRSIVKLGDGEQNGKLTRWRNVAAAAAKQCRRARIPQVYPARTLSEALDILPDDCRLLVPWEEECSAGLPDYFSRSRSQSKGQSEGLLNAAVLIGPEGGLDKAEVDLARQRGGQAVSLGPRILRSSTAALAALSILMYQWGDIGNCEINP